MSWTTIESDPGVFTELISTIGVRGVQVEEIYDLDSTDLSELEPIYGFIFLFKWVKEDAFDGTQGRRVLNAEETANAPVFFARQTVNNACATQAILTCLLNRPELDLGPELRSFLEFASALPPDMRGDAIGNNDAFRESHNAFARPEPFVFDREKDDSDEAEDAFHFITYVPVDGVLYELDGLRPGPISLGPCVVDDAASNASSSSSSWLRKVRDVIQRRIAKYQKESTSEIRFNLLALVRDRVERLDERLAQLNERKQSIGSAMTDAESESAIVDEQIADVKRQLSDERIKREQWKVENERRKHNYVPFVFKLLNMLADNGKLAPLIENAVKLGADRQERVAAQKKLQANQKKEAAAVQALLNADTSTKS